MHQQGHGHRVVTGLGDSLRALHFQQDPCPSGRQAHKAPFHSDSLFDHSQYAQQSSSNASGQRKPHARANDYGSGVTNACCAAVCSGGTTAVGQRRADADAVALPAARATDRLGVSRKSPTDQPQPQPAASRNKASILSCHADFTKPFGHFSKGC